MVIFGAVALSQSRILALLELSDDRLQNRLPLLASLAPQHDYDACHDQQGHSISSWRAILANALSTAGTGLAVPSPRPIFCGRLEEFATAGFASLCSNLNPEAAVIELVHETAGGPETPPWSLELVGKVGEPRGSPEGPAVHPHHVTRPCDEQGGDPHVIHLVHLLRTDPEVRRSAREAIARSGSGDSEGARDEPTIRGGERLV